MLEKGLGQQYFENLDALRFFSFFAVFLSHAVSLPHAPGETGASGPVQWAHLGRLGVDCFFVLSSFLITWLGLKEASTTGGFRLNYFFLRRILRIWPLYFLMVGIALAGVAMQHILGKEPSELPPPAYLFTFTLNFYISSYGPGFLFFLVFLWSIAVEEQFYVAWGLLLRYFRKHIEGICLLLVLASGIFRFARFPDSYTLYFHSMSVAGDFALGALLAKQAVDEKGLFRLLTHAGRGFWALCYCLLAASLLLYTTLFQSQAMVSLERTWFALLFALLIAEQVFARNPLLRYGRWAPVNYLGRISYGLYCYHGLALTLAAKFLEKEAVTGIANRSLLSVILFLFTTFAAMASYRFFEKPFLDLKKKFYPA